MARLPEGAGRVLSDPARLVTSALALVAEDNAADARLIRAAFKDSRIRTEVHTGAVGVAALAYLREQGDYKSARRQSVLFLDLDMRRKDGHHVLEEVKRDPDLRSLPSVIVTSSGRPEDCERAYQHHANCYVRKPTGFGDFTKAVQDLKQFWFETVELPA
ncbi:MAG: response regulator [Euryarchaeota archaeon]|nr:response regulator [Euryarchaeota archaeon]